MGKDKLVYVGRGVVFVRKADGSLVRVETKKLTWKERLFTARVVGRD